MVKIKNIPNSDKPRERLYMYGAESLSNEELLAIVLKTGTKKYGVKEVALKLLAEIGDISKLRDMGINLLMKIEGIGLVKAIELKAICELGKRINSNNVCEMGIVIDSSLVVYNIFQEYFLSKKQEYFYCLYMDTKKKLIEKKCLFMGTINSSLVSPREIFREAYLVGASGIICVHNHPSGDSNPSRQDREITRRLKELAIIHDIELVDHVIIGKNNYFSFMENHIFWISNS